METKPARALQLQGGTPFTRQDVDHWEAGYAHGGWDGGENQRMMITECESHLTTEMTARAFYGEI